MQREIGRFQAEDVEGTVYTIIEYQNFINTTHLGSKGRTEMPSGLKDLVTAEGHAVNCIDEDTFLIAPLGITVTVCP